MRRGIFPIRNGDDRMSEYKIIKTARDKGFKSAAQKMRDMSARGWTAVNVRPHEDTVLITFKKDI